MTRGKSARIAAASGRRGILPRLHPHPEAALTQEMPVRLPPIEAGGACHHSNSSRRAVQRTDSGGAPLKGPAIIRRRVSQAALQRHAEARSNDGAARRLRSGGKRIPHFRPQANLPMWV